MEDFVGAKFYCPHALSDGKQFIQIREKIPEFSLTALSTLFPYRNRGITIQTVLQNEIQSNLTGYCLSG